MLCMAKSDKIARWESQVRKGFLDFVVLICLQSNRLYGYELIVRLKKSASLEISEGTIYPLLNRMAKDDLIESEWVEMQTGIPRKYYSLTSSGRETLASMKLSWKRFSQSVERLLDD
jgi:PadR family transcriptional regulator PadR